MEFKHSLGKKLTAFAAMTYRWVNQAQLIINVVVNILRCLPLLFIGLSFRPMPAGVVTHPSPVQP